MKRMTYRLEDQYGNPTDSIILESDLIFLNSSEKLKKVLSRLAAIEDILGDEYDLDHLRELAQADRDGRIKIIPKSAGECCGNCGNFKVEPGTKHGTCDVRGHFVTFRSRKACKNFVEVEQNGETVRGAGEL